MKSYFNFLFASTIKNIHLYVIAFVSIIAILCMFLINVANQNASISDISAEHYSGLNNSHYLQIAFYILFIMPLACFAVFTQTSGTNQGFELSLMSKNITRTQIYLCRLLFMVVILASEVFLMTLSLLPALVVDKMMQSGDKLKWIFSNIFGSLIIGISFLGFVMLVSTVLSYKSSLFTSVALPILFPIISVAVYNSKNGEESNGFKLITNQYNDAEPMGLYCNSEIEGINPVIEENVLKFSGVSVMPTKKVWRDSFDAWQIAKGMKEYHDSISYKSFASLDQWNAISNYLDIFSSNDNKSGFKYLDAINTKAINAIYGKVTSWNSVTFGDKTYLLADKGFKTSNHPTYEINQYTSVGHVKKDIAYINKVMNEFIALLKHDDALASEYKQLSFYNQMHWWARVMEYYDDSTDLKTFVKTRPNSYERIHDGAGFYPAKQMMLKNPRRYASNRVSFDGKGGPILIDLDSMLHLQVHTPYKESIAWMVIIPLFGIAFGIASYFVYMKKNIK